MCVGMSGCVSEYVPFSGGGGGGGGEMALARVA